MCRLVRLYAANVLTKEAIIDAGENLSQLDFAVESQLADENLGVGTEMWITIAALEEEQDVSQFFGAVRKFYTATLKKRLKKFPFDDTLLKDLGVLQPEKTSNEVETIISLVERFPQLDLSDPKSLDCLREEFLNFSLSPMDLPFVATL